MNELESTIARGWQVTGASYVKPGQAREFRVVLVNRALGRKLFGFGESFGGALVEAVKQMLPSERA